MRLSKLILTRLLGLFEIDRVDLEQREVALAFLRAADMTVDRVAGAQAEAADLRRRDVDVIRAGQVVVIGGAQEAEAVGQGLEDAVAVDFTFVGCGVLQEREDEVLASHAADAFDVQLRAHMNELAHLLALQLCQIHEGVSRSVA